MEKEMLPVKIVSDEDGYIYLSQEWGYFNDQACIKLHSDQIDTLIQWLNEEKEKLAED